jgi:prophage regulatory protein
MRGRKVQTPKPVQPGDRILREFDVNLRLPRSRAQRWRDEREGKHPKRVKIGANAVGWLESEIDAHVAALAAQRHAPAA